MRILQQEQCWQQVQIGMLQKMCLGQAFGPLQTVVKETIINNQAEQKY